jgi:hypothetical protein
MRLFPQIDVESHDIVNGWTTPPHALAEVRFPPPVSLVVGTVWEISMVTVTGCESVGPKELRTRQGLSPGAPLAEGVGICLL